jgi:hypothetical protein
MTSDERHGRPVLLALALLAGCTSGGVHDLSVPSEPLLVIHGHVNLATIGRQNRGFPLIGALVWAGVARIAPLCLKYAAPQIRAACKDPYGFFFGETERAAPVDADGNFDLVLPHLPAARVSVGDEVTRIAYGSLMVAEDLNGDGQLYLGPFGNRRGIPPGGDMPMPSASVPSGADVVVAASFHTLRAEQHRVVFREGGFVEDSNFYPAPGCAPPPRGFSFEDAPAYTEPPATPGPCGFRPPDVQLEVSPLAPAETTALQCRPAPNGFRARRAMTSRPNPSTPPICLAPDVLAVIIPGTCPALDSYLLKGCSDDPFCTAPEWDDTASPPDWWPCH